MENNLYPVEEQERWKIKNDDEAEWWIEKHSDELVEIRRLKMSIENKLRFMQEKLQKVMDEEKGLISNRDYFLREYFDGITEKQKKIAKTQIKYRLPSVDLVWKKPREKFIRDDDMLIDWLQKSDLDKYVKIKKTPDWAEFKKYTKVVGDVVVADNGEIVEGVRVEMSEEGFEVKE